MAATRHLPKAETVLCFGLLFAIYLVTDPGNRFESIDGYDYAQAAEIVPLQTVHDSRSILFHKLNRVLFLAAKAVGLPFDGHLVIRLLCMASAVGSVFLLRHLLLVRFSLSWTTATVAALSLAFSYGFWRYAHEAEVYTPSAFLILATIALLLRGMDTRGAALATFAGAGILGGLACLYYQGNAVALCLAAPVLLLHRERWSGLMAYGIGGGAVAVGGLLAAHLISESAPLTLSSMFGFIAMRFGEFDIQRAIASPLVGSTYSLLHVFTSLNWLYGLEPFISYVSRNVPGHFSRLEGYSYSAVAFRPYVYAGLPLFLTVAALTLALMVTAFRHRTRVAFSSRHAFLLVWVTVNLLVNVRLGPWEPEVWITMLPAIVMALAVWVLEPAAMAGAKRLLWALPLAMLAHNALGGVLIFKSEHGLHYAKTRWLAAELRPDDVVLVNMDDQRIWNYLRYKLGARLLYSDGVTANAATIDERFHDDRAPLDEMLARAHGRGGRVFTIGDLTKPQIGIQIRSGAVEYRRAQALAKRLEGRSRLVHPHPLAPIYEVRP